MRCSVCGKPAKYVRYEATENIWVFPIGEDESPDEDFRCEAHK